MFADVALEGEYTNGGDRQLSQRTWQLRSRRSL